MSVRAKVLVVDDEPFILVSLSRALELEGYEVVKAASVAEARAALEKARPDLALFDVKLPDGDGIALLEKLAKGGVCPPIIMMSGHGHIDDAVRAVRLGALDFLEKPIAQDRLLLSIANALELARLKRENERLREEARRARGDEEMIGRSSVMESLKKQIQRVAASEGRVLITGENGTGKELIARAIHDESPRSGEAFVSLNCAAVPAELIESELFGHEKGSFTGATARKLGRFERADKGTLFLDEVGDMPAAMQAKLLRVLQTNEVERVGGHETIRVDVRVIAATNKDLLTEIAEGRFREDLYYRLAVVPLVAPPLRERREDIPLLVEHFLAHAAARNRRKPPKLTPSAMAVLAGHDYPGNIRELRNFVERIVIMTSPDDETLDDADLRGLVPMKKKPAATADLPTPTYKEGARLSDLVEEAERAIVAAALEAHGGVIAEAARALGVERSNFHKKVKALGLR